MFIFAQYGLSIFFLVKLIISMNYLFSARVVVITLPLQFIKVRCLYSLGSIDVSKINIITKSTSCLQDTGFILTIAVFNKFEAPPWQSASPIFYSTFDVKFVYLSYLNRESCRSHRHFLKFIPAASMLNSYSKVTGASKN